MSLSQTTSAFLMLLHEMSPYLLLGFFVAGVLHAFVPRQLYARLLGGTGWRSVAGAAAIGVPLPLCSCGVLPTAVSLHNGGASKAATTSFLIATPQTGVDSIAATYAMMGLPMAVLRPLAALVTAIAGGLTAGTLERHGLLGNSNTAPHSPVATATADAPAATLSAKILDTFKYGFFDMMQSIGRWLLLGLVIATLITVLLPDDFFTAYARWPLLNMLIIVAVAVPMYVCATGSIPIAAALMLKGLSPGCALVLLMAGPAANLASVLLLRKQLGARATAVYVGSIVSGAIIFGLLVDYLPGLRQLITDAMPPLHHASHAMHTGVVNQICSAALLTMIAVALVAGTLRSKQLSKHLTDNDMITVKVNGMMCAHCRATVEKGIASLNGVDKVEVDLDKGLAYVHGTVDIDTICQKVAELGYQAQQSPQ